MIFLYGLLIFFFWILLGTINLKMIEDSLYEQDDECVVVMFGIVYILSPLAFVAIMAHWVGSSIYELFND